MRTLRSMRLKTSTPNQIITNIKTTSSPISYGMGMMVRGVEQESAHRVEAVGERQGQRDGHQEARQGLDRELRAGEQPDQVAGHIHQGIGVAHQQHDGGKCHAKAIQPDQHGDNRHQRQQHIPGRVKTEQQRRRSAACPAK